MERSVFLLFIAVPLFSCNNVPPAGTMPQRDTLAKSEAAQPSQAQRTRDSIKNEKYRSDIQLFYRKLIDTSAMLLDTTWRKLLDKDINFEDAYIRLPANGDDPAQSVAFPFADLKFVYHNTYFSINGQRVPEKLYTNGNRFPIPSIRKFSYHGGKYLVFTGRLTDFNGYGGRIHFNYFFDLSNKKVVADMYQNSWEWVYEPCLYGDLNKDTDLDRIRFDGIAGPSMQEYDTVTITAETYKNHKWVPLNSDDQRPYSIKVIFDLEKWMIKPVEEHWMHPVWRPE